MLNDELQIKTVPNQSDLDEIEMWLIEEYDKIHEGFYCNWNILLNAFQNNELIILNFETKAIGFLVWSKNDMYIDIDIFVINPNYRNKGKGSFFFSAVSEFFRKKGFLAIKLFCSPRESETFWRKMGLQKFPDRGYSESDLTYYGTLIRTQATTDNTNVDNKVELWDVEPYQISNNKPRWTWYVEMKDNELILPIIQPCNCNWNLRWTKNDKVIRENKVKYFDTTDNCVNFNPFLYIKRLVE